MDKPSEAKSLAVSKEASRVSLTAVSQEMSELQRALESGGDDDSGNFVEALTDTLEGITMEFNDKIIACLQVCKKTELPVMALQHEVERLQKRIASIGKKTGWLKGYARDAMIALGQDKVIHPLATVSLRHNADKLVIDDDAVPAEYLLAPTVKINIDRKKIKQDLKNKVAGVAEFAHFEEGSITLQVR